MRTIPMVGKKKWTIKRVMLHTGVQFGFRLHTTLPLNTRIVFVRIYYLLYIPRHIFVEFRAFFVYLVFF